MLVAGYRFSEDNFKISNFLILNRSWWFIPAIRNIPSYLGTVCVKFSYTSITSAAVKAFVRETMTALPIKFPFHFLKEITDFTISSLVTPPFNGIESIPVKIGKRMRYETKKISNNHPYSIYWLIQN